MAKNNGLSPVTLVVDFAKGVLMKRERKPQKRQLYDTQSISASTEEKVLFEILGLAEGIKAATIARRLLFLGLSEYIKHRQLPETSAEADIYKEAMALVETDPSLSAVKQVLDRQPQRIAKQPGRKKA